MFRQYAEFVFGQFGQLVHSWVTLGELDEFGDAELRKALDADASVYHQYHQKFPRRGRRVIFHVFKDYRSNLTNIKKH